MSLQVTQHQWNADRWTGAPLTPDSGVQLVLSFANPAALRQPKWRDDIRAAFPEAIHVGCSTAGEIAGIQVLDQGVTCTTMRFERTRLRAQRATVEAADDSMSAGTALGRALVAEDLRHVLLLSDGLHVNGSALVAGLTGVVGEDVGVTGGLSADGDRFGETLVLFGATVAPGQVAAVGFYGDHVKVGCGSLGGWDPFGPERLVTRAEGNVLFELDGRSALSLYETYLGDHAAGLPATALLFPLSIRASMRERPVVRTILAVDPVRGSMTFAGDVPQGAYAQLMRANVDRLVDGAAGAARTSAPLAGETPPALALLISCVGRRLVLKQRVEEELEAVREVMGPDAILAGFYSYGEISPFTPTARCELHNQTMTITTFAEG